MARPPWAAPGPQHPGRVTSLNLQVQGTGGPAAGPQGPLLLWVRGGQVMSGSAGACPPRGWPRGAWLFFLLPLIYPPALYFRALLADPASCLPSYRGVVHSPSPLPSAPTPGVSLLPTSPQPTPVSLYGLVWPNFCLSRRLAPHSCSSDIKAWSGTRLPPFFLCPSASCLTPKFLETLAAL